MLFHVVLQPGFQPTPQVAVPGPDVELEAYLDKHYINMIWTVSWGVLPAVDQRVLTRADGVYGMV